MNVEIRYVNSPEEECAVLKICQNHPGIMKLQEIIEKGIYQTITVPCFIGEQRYFISCEHILYIETIQEILFVHTGSKVYEAKKRLYELEKMLPEQFVRVSKSVIMNLKQVEYYSPLANGLMKATFYNGEETYISRKYLRLLRTKIGGRNS
ncbi:LytTR family DNA-binding domain-containing protein [Clostridium sp. OS1-26]|uniref:LytTR family DNA-binding domain-containing protein n=1 Tax=Clostridium sp. OS1-26 TaxID=3070681 RepID=UPI0027DFE7A2|nr:LytTR family DNA-binding domain-containing protein [Clostridium sp. OS1-26]WML32793.1 LytTR family DNA-binding domain-containing protein [Clostridium sp. OS1-26]